MGGGRRRRNAKRKTAPAAKVDAVPDELLELVFLRLKSPADLVRAASTCRRWRSVIAADSFRALGSLRGAPSSYLAGHYRVSERPHAPRPPGENPVFVPSSSSPWADVVAARNLALDFLPRSEYGGRNWELMDIRGGILLLLDSCQQSPLVVCDPLARRCRTLPRSAWFHNREFMGAFLLDGDDASTSISLSNFRVTCALYSPLMLRARACTFSSARGGRWTSGGRSTAGWGSTGTSICYGGCSDYGSEAYWTIGGVHTLLALDKEAAELTSSVIPEMEYIALRHKRNAAEYKYDLPWPPTIRTCLS